MIANDDERRIGRRPAASGGISRRQFVTRAALAGVSLTAAGATLAACGSGSAAGENEPKAIDTTLPNELRLLGWEDYMSPKAVKAFETATGVKVVLVPYGGVPEGITMLQKGEIVDVVMAGNAYLRTLREGGLVQPLNMDLLPNMANVTDEALARPGFDNGDGGKFSAPYMFGTSGFAVRLDVVKNARESWDMLWDDAYKGDIGVIDDSGECIAMALIKLGLPASSSSPQDIDAAKRALIEQRPLVKVYSSMSMAADIEAGMALRHCWDGDAIRAINKIGLSKVRYVLPEEGFTTWIDTLSVHAKAPSPYAAHLFINHLLDSKVAAENANFTGYQTAVATADPLVKSLVQRAMRPTAEDLARGQSVEASAETTAAYEAAFKEVKAS